MTEHILDRPDQQRAPIYEALSRYKSMRIVPFDVPGHKQGRGNPELREFLGEKCVSIDVNSMKPLDNLSHPVSVIKEAEELAAAAFGCDCSFFMVGGTTSSVQAMLMSCLNEGDKLIMPRNVHRSAINAMIVIGAEPVYVNPGIHADLGITLGMATEDILRAIAENPDAKAVFVNNPTYYGVCSNLQAIIDAAHARGMAVLADEAHGTHLYFGGGLPSAAMSLGADMASVSMHKTGGSLTQSSILLVNRARVNPDYVRTVINISQTTSASYLLLTSLDIARKNLALNGRDIFARVTDLAGYARDEINRVPGLYAFGGEIINGDSIYAFDGTKLSVNTLDIGLAGIEVYDILRDEYHIQAEFGDMGGILCIISVGDGGYAIERLCLALSEIARRYRKPPSGLHDYGYVKPNVVLSPRAAFYAQKRRVKFRESCGEISGEFVMCYPPGIPIMAPGEEITRDALDAVLISLEKGCLVTGAEDMSLEYINVLKK